MYPSITVFVDTCIFQQGFPYKPGKKAVEINWGGRNFSVETDVYVDKEFPTEKLSQEIKLLSKIAEVTQTGRIELITSELVARELEGAPGNSKPSHPGHIFEHCGVREVRSGLIFQIGYGYGFGRIRDQLARSFENYPDRILQEVRKKLGGNRLIDSVHLITAERNAAKYFLTTDQKLIDAFRREPDMLKIWPVLPSELLRNLHNSC
ncbi:MAG: hypothetical protein H7343_17535 [Undibacterium sp.]|nr:hypothetical protein [Opitutaceae bacterium]